MDEDTREQIIVDIFLQHKCKNDDDQYLLDVLNAMTDTELIQFEMLVKTLPRCPLLRNFTFGMDHLRRSRYADYRGWDDDKTRIDEFGNVMYRLPTAMLPPIELKSEDDLITVSMIRRRSFSQKFPNKFLLCSAIQPSVRFGVLSSVVMDHEGGIVMLTVANFNCGIDTPTCAFCPEALPVNVFILIMHPFYQHSLLTRSGTIRVDNPAHIRLCLLDDPMLARLPARCKNRRSVSDYDADARQKFGDACLTAKVYWNAIWWYEQAISKKPSQVLFEKRSEIYTKVNMPELALEDIERGLYMEPTNKFLLERRVLTLALLNRPNEALQFLEKTKPLLDCDDHIGELYRKVLRIRDECLGRYDFKRMVEESKTNLRLTGHVDYVAPFIALKKLQDNNYVYVATENIPAGTLVMVCKALAFYPSGNYYKWRKLASVDATTQLCDWIVRHPHLSEKFYKLYTNPKNLRQQQVNEEQPLDIGRVSQIKPAYMIDARNMRGRTYGFGVWLDPSFLQSSCIGCNCNRLFIGDFQLVRTCSPIRRSEPLSVAAIEPLTTPSAREEFTKSVLGGCHCALCQLESTETMEAKRRLFKLGARSFDGSLKLRDLDRMGDEALAMRSDRTLNFSLVAILSNKLYAKSDKRKEKYWREVLTEVLDILEQTGHHISAWRTLRSAFQNKDTYLVNLDNHWKDKFAKLSKLLFGDTECYGLIQDVNLSTAI